MKCKTMQVHFEIFELIHLHECCRHFASNLWLCPIRANSETNRGRECAVSTSPSDIVLNGLSSRRFSDGFLLSRRRVLLGLFSGESWSATFTPSRSMLWHWFDSVLLSIHGQPGKLSVFYFLFVTAANICAYGLVSGNHICIPLVCFSNEQDAGGWRHATHAARGFTILKVAVQFECTPCRMLPVTVGLYQFKPRLQSFPNFLLQ